MMLCLETEATAELLRGSFVDLELFLLSGQSSPIGIQNEQYGHLNRFLIYHLESIEIDVHIGLQA